MLSADKLLKSGKTVVNNNIRYTISREFRGKSSPTPGTPPWKGFSLSEYLEKCRRGDLSVHYRVNIGLPWSSSICRKKAAERAQFLAAQAHDVDKMKQARNDQLLVPLDEAHKSWVRERGVEEAKVMAEHYAVFEHLFGDAFFHPVVGLALTFHCPQLDDVYLPVYLGNSIKPIHAQKEPIVEIVDFEKEAAGQMDDSLYSLILTTPDGHLNRQDAEYVHWFIGNLPSSGLVEEGETVVDYLQPFPTKGTGFHRYVFVLYKQTQKMDYAALKTSFDQLRKEEGEANGRTFSTYDFYKERQDYLTPAGLCFFQSDWDSTVTDLFHNRLKNDEPRFIYDFPKPYENPQEWFPKREPFNVYLDRFRDPKEISKEVLLERLKDIHPFEKPAPPLKYPNAHTLFDSQHLPSWLQVQVKKNRLGWGNRVNDNLDILKPK